METVTNEMLKSFDEPTVEKIEEENMGKSGTKTLIQVIWL